MWLLQTRLKGHASEVFSNLDNTDDYDSVKEIILSAYCITTEVYRQNFRNSIKSNMFTSVEFPSEKMKAFMKWIKSATVTTLEELYN